MAIINIYLNLRPEYKALLDDFIKFTAIILIFHTLLSLSNGKSPTDLGLAGDLFNNSFITIFIYILISVYVYHMIVKKLIEIR